MKKKRRIIALLLAVCMFCSILISPSYAVGTMTLTDNLSNGNLTDGKTESAFDIPDIIEEVESENVGYVGRITENEPDLNTFVFDNGDGTYTMKVYSHPVKFIDADGEIKDITTDIKAISGGFQTADNNIVTTFAQKITDGITLEYDDIEIKMIPAFTSSATASVSAIADAVLSTDGKSVNYAIDDNTSFEYELTYMGFKENIVVNEYTGQTEYSFILYTNGLSPVEIGGSWFMKDAYGSIKATVGDIIIFTADERNNTLGSMSWQNVKEDQIYAMTIHVDAEYLSSPATVYPIRIDPTIEINYDNDGVGAIEDIIVNSEDPHLGSETFIKIGTHPDDNSTSRALMRFPNLDVEGFIITSSRIIIRDIICESTQTPIECHEYIGSVWTESAGINWSDVPNTAIGDLLDTRTVYYGNGNAGDGAIHWYGFDITDLAKKWSSGAADPAKGVIFKATDAFESATDKYYKTFASYNRANYKPYLSVTFEFNPFYSTYQDAGYYQNAQNPNGYGYLDDNLQLRANCYGYAFKMFYALDTFADEMAQLDGSYCYKQQPGEFADKSSGISMYSYNNPSNIIETIYNYSDLMDYYGEYIFNDWKAIYDQSFVFDLDSSMYYLVQLLQADANTLGYTLTEYVGEDIPTAQEYYNKRLIALVLSEYDYHFYIQHYDNTWSHKPGQSVPNNKCLDCDLYLTNDNIGSHACEGIYDGGVVKFFYITKSASIDQGHLRGSYDDCNGTSTVYADTAGNYFASATEITIPREYHSRKIDYRGDIDYYTFTNDTAGDYLFEFTANQGVPLTVVLYNERQEVLQTYYSAVGDIEFEYTLNENSIYVISVSSSGQTEHEFVRSYNISITESS